MGISQKALDDIESLIDKKGLGDVLIAVSQICFYKSLHIAENYGEKDYQVKEWNKAGDKIDACAEAVIKINQQIFWHG